MAILIVEVDFYQFLFIIVAFNVKFWFLPEDGTQRPHMI